MRDGGRGGKMGGNMEGDQNHSRVIPNEAVVEEQATMTICPSPWLLVYLSRSSIGASESGSMDNTHY